MSSVPQGDYQSIVAMEGRFGEDTPLIVGARRLTGKNFFVEVAGNTNNTHTSFVSHMMRMGYVEVQSPEASDFILVFCPVVSRVGTDIGEALQNLDPEKAKVLVVMHHTFNPDVALAESRRQVEDPNVLLTVDCLFFESDLLSCNRNDIAWDQICRSLGIQPPQSSLWERLRNRILEYKWSITGCVAVVTVLIVLASVFGSQNKH